MTDAPPVGPGVELAGRYRLYREIGRGAVARVWEAQDLRLERRVAVKTLAHDADEALDRFEQEARTAAALDHPAVIDVLDVGHDGDTAYLVLRLVEGTTLASELEDGPLDPRRAREVIAAVAEGLAAAHVAGVVHGDVKPSNILLAEDGDVLLADFGVARWVEAATDGPLLGTRAYLAPEQLLDGITSSATDVHALGLVLLEALTGARAGTERTTDQHGAPELPDDLPDDLAAVVRDATARRPEDRPSAAALAERLRRAPRRDATRVLGDAPAAPPAAAPSDDTTVVLDRADDAPLVGVALPAAVDERLEELRRSGAEARGRLRTWWRERGHPWWDAHVHVPRGVLVVGAVLVGVLLLVALSGGEPTPAPVAGSDGGTLPPALEDALTQLEDEVAP